MGLIDKVIGAGERASASARASVQEAQLKQDLAQAYGDLGRMAFALVEEGALIDERTSPPVERIRQLKSQLVAVTTPEMKERTT